MANLTEIIRRRLLGFAAEPQIEKAAQSPALYRVNNPNIVVSVIINYYAKQSTILSVLEKLSAQLLASCSPDEIEIIIVDDGTEGEDIREHLPANIGYLWQRKAGFGAGRARNTGAKIANGKYLFFLDADILVSETYVEAALRGFQKYGDRIVQCGYVWDYLFESCPDPRTEFGVWEDPNHLTSRFFQVASGSLALSRSLFGESKGFDEDLIYGGVEDLLFGYQISLVPETAVYFNREMECRHIPHPPSVAHAMNSETTWRKKLKHPGQSWDVVKIKYPDFYQQYIVQGLR